MPNLRGETAVLIASAETGPAPGAPDPQSGPIIDRCLMAYRQYVLRPRRRTETAGGVQCCPELVLRSICNCFGGPPPARAWTSHRRRGPFGPPYERRLEGPDQ